MTEVSTDKVMQVMGQIHARSDAPQKITDYWSELREHYPAEVFICTHCTDCEYTFQPWPCTDLQALADGIGWDGDWESIAVNNVFDKDAKTWSQVPAAEAS